MPDIQNFMPNLFAGPPQRTGILGTPQVQAPKTQFRDLGDTAATRKMVYDNVLREAQSLQPVSNRRHTLRLSNVAYSDDEDFTPRKQKEAILGRQSLYRRLKGTWELLDNETGDVLDTRDAVVAHVPYISNRGTLIHNGNEYTINHQLRLRPGIFTRTKANGEIEAHVNILPGQGVAHRYQLDPEKNIFRINIGQASIPLITVLKALGAKDSQLQKAWGGEIYAANMQRDNPATLNKLYSKLVRRGDPQADIADKQLAVAEAIRAMKMDGEVNQETLGAPYENLDLDSILATTQKLIAVSRGEADVDDRDHLAYQTVAGPEDLFAERLRKDHGGLRRKLLHKASLAGHLRSMPSGALSKQLEATFLSSGLGESLEEVNPLEIFDKQTKITRMGEGGLPSIDAIPDEARSVQPSHHGFIDPLRTPESSRAGVDSFLASQVRKGSDGRLYAPMRDVRTGKTTHISAQQLTGKTIAFAGEMKKNSKRVAGMRGGKLGYYPRKEIDYELPHMEHAFSPLSSLVPMKSGVKGQRAVMAARMITQALPLDKAEAPWVQTGMPGEEDKSFEDLFGSHAGAVRAQQGGRVLGVDNDSIQVQYADGTKADLPLYHNFAFNRKTSFHNTPLVAAGESFKPGQILAKSNYTDDNGTVALGKNLRVAYVPFRGLNFEDAIVISESAAKKLSSEHVYQHGLEVTDDYKTGKSDFIGMFPGKFTRSQLDNIDDDGVIREGTTVHYGDPLVLAAKRQERAHNKVHRKRQPVFGDSTITWKHHSPGVVVDSFRGKKGPTVVVKSLSEMQQGDKLSGRYGDKGVIADIIPDDEMPHGPDGNPFEVLLSPLGVISRTNPAQVVEAVLGQIAAKTGKPYKVKDFEDIEDLTEWALGEARKHGITDTTSTLTDPESGKGIRAVLTGNRFFMKLHHMAEAKGQGRGTGGYTASGEPAKGGESGSKKVGVLDLNALLSHGATSVIRDVGAIRGQRNEEYWLPFMQGLNPPKPKVPMVYEKFVNQLRGAGINVVERDAQTHIMAMTDKDVDALSGSREIKSGETVRFEKGLEPIKGGLFDEKLTGGHDGNRWAHIKLPEPMPNPVMEEPMRRLLGLTQKKFEAVLSGREKLGEFGTGPAAIQTALGKINVDKAIANAREQIKSGRKMKRDEAVRRLGYLKSCQKLGIHPKDWMVNKVPVLPPRFRPVATMSDKKLPLVSDANFLYKELLEANDNLREMRKLVGEDVADERLATYNAYKAVTGLGAPVHPKLREKNVKGILKEVFGNSPKTGTLQKRLLSSTVDIVGRAVITPDPGLDMDSIGLPENRAWEVYRPFVARRLKRRGMPLSQALRAIEDRTSLAREELVKEMDARPVIANRAPVLHRFGMMAFKPRLVKGETLRVSPLVVGGFGADFDGDMMNYQVPVKEDAVREALDIMLPSKNLFAPSDFKSVVHKPTQDYTGGLYAATHGKSERKPRTFRSTKDMIAAYRRGEIDVDDPVEILNP